MNVNEERAILFVMDFYQVSREQACELYQDEIKAYMFITDNIHMVKDENDESDT